MRSLTFCLTSSWTSSSCSLGSSVSRIRCSSAASVGLKSFFISRSSLIRPCMNFLSAFSSANKRSTSSRTLLNTGSVSNISCSVQAMPAIANSLSITLPGCCSSSKKPVSFSAIFMIDICVRPISSFITTGKESSFHISL